MIPHFFTALRFSLAFASRFGYSPAVASNEISAPDLEDFRSRRWKVRLIPLPEGRCQQPPSVGHFEAKIRYRQ